MSLEKYKKVIHEDFSKNADFIDNTIKHLDLDKNSSILDIGTGFGAMPILLAINGYTVTTGQPETDPEWDEHKDHHSSHNKDSHHNHQEHGSFNFDWEENARALGVEKKIKFQFMHAEDLPFSDGSFDGIFMYDTLQHIENKKLALDESIRVLRSNGLITIIEWNKKAIEEDYKKYGFKIDFIDPREYISIDTIKTQIFRGNLLNIYVLQK
ncbi:MAG: class I SAM-dependent methyltransferase [Promethearchaeota archaeon]|jgi:SAM-dependent methyltransferase